MTNKGFWWSNFLLFTKQNYVTETKHKIPQERGGNIRNLIIKNLVKPRV